MANVLDRKVAEGRIVKDCWDSKTAYSDQSQSENINSKVASTRRRSSSFLLLGASNTKEDSMNNSNGSSSITLVLSNEKNVSSYLPQNFSDLDASLGFPKLDDQDKPKLRKISSVSDLGKTFSTNNCGESNTILQSKSEEDLKNMGRTTPRGSLPGSYLGKYLSVNSILKRVHSHNAINDSTESDLSLSVMSKGRQQQMGERNCARRTHRSYKKNRNHCFHEDNSVEAVKEPKHFSESNNSRGNDINERVIPSLMPIERFRKIVQLLSFLLKMKTSMDRKYRSQQASVVFAELDEQTMTGVDCDGVVFDPRNFKAVKEVQLSQEATHILSLGPGSRSPEQLQTALVALKTSVAAFGEYPLKMQKKLVSVGWYERFEAKRVIIRQGHRAENFYFILSGTAIVTLLTKDSSTGEQRNTTIAVLGKGSSFGELALLHHKTRSATVLCKDEVSLLAVCREDFRDIFMGYEDGKEPEHIRFIKSVPFFKDLPVEDLSTKHDLCIFHYFRRGVVIVNESKTDWIYVVKTGSCRVLTHISKKTPKLKRSLGKQTKSKEFLPVIPIDEFERRRALYTAAGDRIRPDTWSPEGKRPRTEPLTSSEKKRDLTLPVLVDEQDKFKKTARNVACIARMNMIHQEVKARETHREQIEKLHRKISTMDKCSNKRNKTCFSETDLKGERVVVQIELLKPKDQFGLSVLLFDYPAVKCHLVSNGAECVLIKKSWFLQYANEATLRKLRNQIPPYPSQDTLEQKMQDQADWDSYKTQTMNNLLNTLHI